VTLTPGPAEVACCTASARSRSAAAWNPPSGGSLSDVTSGYSTVDQRSNAQCAATGPSLSPLTQPSPVHGARKSNHRRRPQARPVQPDLSFRCSILFDPCRGDRGHSSGRPGHRATTGQSSSAAPCDRFNGLDHGESLPSGPISQLGNVGVSTVPAEALVAATGNDCDRASSTEVLSGRRARMGRVASTARRSELRGRPARERRSKVRSHAVLRRRNRNRSEG
jgi:hypothetical protein